MNDQFPTPLDSRVVQPKPGSRCLVWHNLLWGFYMWGWVKEGGYGFLDKTPEQNTLEGAYYWLPEPPPVGTEELREKLKKIISEIP